MVAHLTADELHELWTTLQAELKRVGAVTPISPREARAAGAPDRLLRLLEALSRMRSGRYGVCLACEGPIAFERLSVIPETATCVECSSVRVA